MINEQAPASNQTEKVFKGKDLMTDEVASKLREASDLLMQFAKAKDLDLFLDIYFDTSTLDVVDVINNIEYEIKSRIDGRPQPLDFSIHKAHISESDSKELKKEISDSNRLLSRWALCDPRGAVVGDLDLDIDDLIKLRDWTDSAVKWIQEKNAQN